MKKRIALLVFCGAVPLSAAYFIIGVLCRLLLMKERGFDITDPTVALSILGPLSVIAAAVALIKFVKVLRSPAVTKEEPKSGPTREEWKAMTRAERRRYKLLHDDVKKKRPPVFAFVFLSAVLVCTFYLGIWSSFSSPLCYHDYAFNKGVNGPAEEGELMDLRFYSDLFFRPYLVYVEKDSGREFDVRLESKGRGEDADGKYTEYLFKLNAKYAKILDCMCNKFTDLSVDLTVKRYKKDGHISADITVVKVRKGAEVYRYEFENRVYSYKALAD